MKTVKSHASVYKIITYRSKDFFTPCAKCVFGSDLFPYKEEEGSPLLCCTGYFLCWRYQLTVPGILAWKENARYVNLSILSHKWSRWRENTQLVTASQLTSTNLLNCCNAIVSHIVPVSWGEGQIAEHAKMPWGKASVYFFSTAFWIFTDCLHCASKHFCQYFLKASNSIVWESSFSSSLLFPSYKHIHTQTHFYRYES